MIIGRDTAHMAAARLLSTPSSTYKIEHSLAPSMIKHLVKAGEKQNTPAARWKSVRRSELFIAYNIAAMALEHDTHAHKYITVINELRVSLGTFSAGNAWRIHVKLRPAPCVAGMWYVTRLDRKVVRGYM